MTPDWLYQLPTMGEDEDTIIHQKSMWTLIQWSVSWVSVTFLPIITLASTQETHCTIKKKWLSYSMTVYPKESSKWFTWPIATSQVVRRAHSIPSLLVDGGRPSSTTFGSPSCCLGEMRLSFTDHNGIEKNHALIKQKHLHQSLPKTTIFCIIWWWEHIVQIWKTCLKAITSRPTA
jgi:hypothetical protein